jgi:hypothetical protein
MDTTRSRKFLSYAKQIATSNDLMLKPITEAEAEVMITRTRSIEGYGPYLRDASALAYPTLSSEQVCLGVLRVAT